MEYIEGFLKNSTITPYYSMIPFHNHPLFLPLGFAFVYIVLYLIYLRVSSHCCCCNAKVSIKKKDVKPCDKKCQDKDKDHHASSSKFKKKMKVPDLQKHNLK